MRNVIFKLDYFYNHLFLARQEFLNRQISLLVNYIILQAHKHRYNILQYIHKYFTRYIT